MKFPWRRKRARLLKSRKHSYAKVRSWNFIFLGVMLNQLPRHFPWRIEMSLNIRASQTCPAILLQAQSSRSHGLMQFAWTDAGRPGPLDHPLVW